MLATAAANGEKASFGDVLEAVRTRLTPDQVLTHFEIWLEITDRAYMSASKLGLYP